MGLIFLAAFIYSLVLTSTGWTESKINNAATKAGIITGIHLLPFALLKKLNKKTLAITLITVYPITFFSTLFNIPWPLVEFFNSLAGAAFA